MVIFFTIIHVLVCVFLVIVVLLQSGKAADLAGAFGGMGSQTAFGPRGAATVLSKATTVAAGLFMVTSLCLAISATRSAGTGGATSILEKHKGPAKSAPAPAAAGTPQTPAAGPQGQQPIVVPPGAPQPTVTLTDPKTGKEVTMPLDLNKLPRVDEKKGTAAPQKK